MNAHTAILAAPETWEHGFLAERTATLRPGDCLAILRSLPDASVDAVVTDPPYGIDFMARAWDSGETVAFRPELWREALRVLKPGGHLAAFSGSRTYHRLACAVEDAGFEIRDQLMWLYGTGFPKSLDVSKALDKAAGAEREIVGSYKRGLAMHPGNEGADNWRDNYTGEVLVTTPATDAARQWAGWGTALKPGHEPIVLARKPLAGTVATNVLAHGTGGLNIDGCRVGESGGTRKAAPVPESKTVRAFGNGLNGGGCEDIGKGRWPANVLHDGASGLGDAERFFYCAKATAADRAGSRHPTVKPVALMRWLCRLLTPPGGTILDPFGGTGTTAAAALAEGFSVTLCEREPEYQDDIRRRLDALGTRVGGCVFD